MVVVVTGKELDGFADVIGEAICCRDPDCEDCFGK